MQPSGKGEKENPPSEDARLRRLRFLVNGLTVCLIGGVLFVSVTLVWRLLQPLDAAPPPLHGAADDAPDGVLSLPEGEEIIAVDIVGLREIVLGTRNRETGRRRILYYDRHSLTLRQSILLQEVDAP